MRLIASLALFVAVASRAGAEPAIVWEHDYDQARARALAEGKPLFIDIYTEWCHYCKEMETDTYPRDEVKAFLAGFVCCQVDAEKANGPSTAKKFGVDGYPTLIVEDALGNKLHQGSGKPPPEGFARSLSEDASSELAAAEGGNDQKVLALAVFKVERWFAGSEAEKRANDVHKRHENDDAFKEAYLAAKAVVDEAVKKAAGEAQKKAEIAAKAEAKDWLDQASTLSKAGKRKEAIEMWKQIVAKYPDFPEAKTARDRLKFNNVKVDEPKKDK